MMLLFESTHLLTRAGRLCRNAQLKCKIIPAPREYTSQCGMALKIEPDVLEPVCRLLDDNEIKYTRYSI